MAKTGTGPCEQIRVLLAWRRSAMKARVAAHRQITALLTTAPDAVRTRFARLSGGELIDALARTRPAPATHRPRIGDRASAAPPGSAATGSRADEITDIDTELRAPTARAAPTMLATKGYGVITTATLLAGADRQPRPNPHRGLLRRPVRRRPDPRRPPGGPTATDSTAAATDRPTGRCTRSPWSACPATRAPRPTPPASPPRARTAKRYCAASNAPSPAKHGTC